MTDISKEAIAEAWEEFEICARPNGSVGDLDVYDTDGMQEYAYMLHQIAVAQSDRIAELEAAQAAARDDALREAAEICRKSAAWDMKIHDQWGTHAEGREKRSDLRASAKAKDYLGKAFLALSPRSRSHDHP